MPQLNVRVGEETLRALREWCARTGVSQRRFVEEAVRDRCFASAPVVPGVREEPPLAVGDAPGALSVNVVVWVSGRLGLPAVVVARKAKRGGLTVNGVPVAGGRVPLADLREVRLDGELVAGP